MDREGLPAVQPAGPDPLPRRHPLPVRVGGDEYEVRSSYGADVNGGDPFLLYDWDYEGGADTDTDPDSVDGTLAGAADRAGAQPAGRARAPETS